jgi:hypothetical protein
VPYCRRCGTQLEENARFCHKCGTEVVIFSAAPPAKSAPKSPVSTAVIVLIAVVAVAVIVSILVFSTFNPVNSHQANPANPANQTNVSKLSFNFQEGKAQPNGLAQNLTDKTGFIAVSATTTQCTNRLIAPVLTRTHL